MTYLIDTVKKKGSTIHRAKWVIADSATIFQDGYLEIENGLIKDIGKWGKNRCGHVIDHGHGVITPSLINSHTHLDLTGLKGKIPFENGFSSWVKKLIHMREIMGEKALAKSSLDGIDELIKSGCCVVGDISTFDSTWDIISKSDIYGVNFKEFIGNFLPEKISCNIKGRNIVASISGHAPHTTSPELITALKNISNRYSLPFSIHLAESLDEIDFFSTGKGAWADLLKERGIDFSMWNISGKTPVDHLKKRGILDKKTIAVHLLYATEKDIKTLADTGTRISLCPRSNFNLHKRLPPLEKILKAGIKPSLGTDSLASVESLSLFDEMAYTASSFPGVPPEVIFDMGTINGAAALGLDKRSGSLYPEKYGIFLYLPLKVVKKSNIMEALVNMEFDDYIHKMRNPSRLGIGKR